MTEFNLSFVEHVNKKFTVGIETDNGITEQEMTFQDAFQRMPNMDYKGIAYVREYNAENTRADGWVSVDTPPLNDDKVLIWPHMDYGDNKITAVYRPWDKKWIVTCYEPNWGDEEYEVEPTHWQKLPQPPAT